MNPSPLPRPTVMDGSNFRRWSLVLAVAALAWSSSGCTELRGRRRVREGNQLYRDGRYAEAVTAYEAAARFIPGFWLLWLNKGLTCRQMMVPGAHTPENDRAVDCALEAFANLKRLRPKDPRAEQLYVQTLFDADRFEALASLYQQRLRARPDDLAAINGLIQAYTRWNRPDEALAYYQQRAALQPRDAEAQYAVGVFVWNQLFQKGGGPEMAAFDPRPDPEEVEAAAKQAPAHGKNRGKQEPKPLKVPPLPGLGDITGGPRVRLADLGIGYLEKALALRPRYRDAMTYLNLLYRQKSFAYFAEPDTWQACIDAAERWRREAESLGRSP
jgi:pentatricopeptide repeat protein